MKIVNKTGYLKGAKTAKNPVNIIPSNLITTQGMAFPIKANGKTLYPNTGQYKFNTPYVVETPLKQDGADELNLLDRASDAAKFTYRIKDKKRRDTQVADMYNNALDSFRGDTTNAKRDFKSFFTDYGSERFDGVRPLEGYYGFDRKDYDDKTLDSLGRDWHKKMKVSKKDNGVKGAKVVKKTKTFNFNPNTSLSTDNTANIQGREVAKVDKFKVQKTKDYNAAQAAGGRYGEPSEEKFYSRYGQSSNEFKYETDPRHRAQIDKKIKEAEKAGRPMLRENVKLDPNAMFMLPTGLKGQAAKDYQDFHKGIIQSALPIPGFKGKPVIPSAKPIANGRLINKRLFGQKLQELNLLKPETNIDLLAQYPNLEKNVTKAALKRFNTSYRSVNTDLDKLLKDADVNDLANMYNKSVDITDPKKLAEYMATHVPYKTYGYRASSPSPVLNQDVINTAKYASDEEAIRKLQNMYGNEGSSQHLVKVRPKGMDFSKGDKEEWLRDYYYNKPFAWKGGELNTSLMTDPSNPTWKSGTIANFFNPNTPGQYWPYIGNKGEQLLEPVKTFKIKKQGSKNVKSVLKYKNGSKSVSLAFSRGEKDPKGGLTQKGVDKYNRATGGNLKMAVTTPPSKLKPGSKAANRRKSFCARMSGVKGPMEKNGKPTRKALALRKWNC